MHLHVVLLDESLIDEQGGSTAINHCWATKTSIGAFD